MIRQHLTNRITVVVLSHRCFHQSSIIISPPHFHHFVGTFRLWEQRHVIWCYTKISKHITVTVSKRLKANLFQYQYFSNFIIPPVGPNRRNFHFEMLSRTYHSDCTLYSGRTELIAHHNIFVFTRATSKSFIKYLPPKIF